MTDRPKFKSFIESTNTRRDYVNCLVHTINFLDSHSDCMKNFRMNNIKGCIAVMRELLKNVDRFIDEGEEIGIVIKEEKKK